MSAHSNENRVVTNCKHPCLKAGKALHSLGATRSDSIHIVEVLFLFFPAQSCDQRRDTLQRSVSLRVADAQLLTLQSLVLLLHAQQEDLLVDGRLPQGSIVGAATLGPLSGWQRAAQGIQGGGAGARRQRQELLAMTVVCRTATAKSECEKKKQQKTTLYFL